MIVDLLFFVGLIIVKFCLFFMENDKFFKVGILLLLG